MTKIELAEKLDHLDPGATLTVEQGVLASLFDAGAQGGLLAGSGSSVFGIFESKEARERALADLKLEEGWQVFSCETISRAEYLESLRSSGVPAITFS